METVFGSICMEAAIVALQNDCDHLSEMTLAAINDENKDHATVAMFIRDLAKLEKAIAFLRGMI